MTPRHLLEPGRLAGAALLKAQSDDRLVDLTRAGNDRAFEAIVSRHRAGLLRYCSRILSDGRAEDAVQQAFLNAYNALHRDTTPLSLKSWLFGIAHNVSVNLLRQRASLPHEELEDEHATGESAAAAAERGERLREVLGAVAALPPAQRDAIVLRELEGLGHEEIARELGVTGGAARQLIRRARTNVRSAAASILPFPLIMRLTDGSTPPPTAGRLAELTAAGGGLTLTKVVTTAAVGGALVGGAAQAPDLARQDRGDRGANVAEASEEPDAARDRESDEPLPSGSEGSNEGSGRSGGGGSDDGPGDSSGPGSGGDRGDDADRDEDHSGPGRGGGEDDDLEQTSDDNSGPGSGDGDEPEEDNSGPGSGSDVEPDTDNSGPGGGGDDDEPEPIELTEPEEDNSGSGGGGSSGPG